MFIRWQRRPGGHYRAVLVESYRDDGAPHPRHRVIANLGHAPKRDPIAIHPDAVEGLPAEVREPARLALRRACSVPHHRMRAEALRRFRADPTRAYQSYISEVASEMEPRERCSSLDGAEVCEVDVRTAAALIRKYEWLGSVGRPRAAYGLLIGGEMVGAVLFARPYTRESGRCFGTEREGRVVVLQRGACAHYARVRMTQPPKSGG